MDIFSEVKPNFLKAIKESGLYKTAEDFANLLDYISSRIFSTPKFESYAKKRILSCYGIDASVYSLRGIIELCRIGDFVDSMMIIRKIRDNLFLDLFLIRCSDDWDDSDVSMPDLEEVIKNPDALLQMLSDFNLKQIEYENTNQYKTAIKKWREGKLLNNADSTTKREFFQFTKYLKYLKEDESFRLCCDEYLKTYFDSLDVLLNDFTHSNSPSNLNNYFLVNNYKEHFKKIESALELLQNLFIISMFFVDSRYFHTEDYENCIEFTHDNPEGLQYNVISDIVEIFEKIKSENPNLHNFLVEHNKYSMKIRLEDYGGE